MSIFVDLQVDGDAQNDATTDLQREKHERTSGEREEHQIKQVREHQDAEVFNPEVEMSRVIRNVFVPMSNSTTGWSPIQANRDRFEHFSVKTLTTTRSIDNICRNKGRNHQNIYNSAVSVGRSLNCPHQYFILRTGRTASTMSLVLTFASMNCFMANSYMNKNSMPVCVTPAGAAEPV